MSEHRLAYLREANRKHREKLRGGAPPMSLADSARLAVVARERNRAEAARKKAELAERRREQRAERREREKREREAL